MRGRRSALSIDMTDQTRRTLQSWLNRPKTPYGRARRTRAILLLEQGKTFVETAQRVGLHESSVRKWARRFLKQGITGLAEKPRPGRTPLFPPAVALYVVKLACERPDAAGRSLSEWSCAELANQLEADGIVESISASTVRAILQSQKLKPWRHHLWLSAKVPRDAQFARQIQEIVDLYTRSLADGEMVWCVDEKTNLQPRPRLAATLPTKPGLPTRLEHEYQRAGALHLFAAFDTRTGKITALTALHKRQKEFLSLLAKLDRETPTRVKRIFLVLDNASIHKGKQVQTWLQSHPRFVCCFVPVHCSWMNQVEQWFSILQRKRLRILDFASRDQLADRLMSFVAQWNAQAHPLEMALKCAQSRTYLVNDQQGIFGSFAPCHLEKTGQWNQWPICSGLRELCTEIAPELLKSVLDIGIPDGVVTCLPARHLPARVLRAKASGASRRE